MTTKKRGVTAEEEERDGRGKEENPLKRAFPPSPAPPSFFPKRFIFGAVRLRGEREKERAVRGREVPHGRDFSFKQKAGTKSGPAVRTRGRTSPLPKERESSPQKDSSPRRVRKCDALPSCVLSSAPRQGRVLPLRFCAEAHRSPARTAPRPRPWRPLRECR